MLTSPVRNTLPAVDSGPTFVFRICGAAVPWIAKNTRYGELWCRVGHQDRAFSHPQPVHDKGQLARDIFPSPLRGLAVSRDGRQPLPKLCQLLTFESHLELRSLCLQRLLQNPSHGGERRTEDRHDGAAGSQPIDRPHRALHDPPASDDGMDMSAAAPTTSGSPVEDLPRKPGALMGRPRPRAWMPPVILVAGMEEDWPMTATTGPRRAGCSRP